jgi:broad specificity phosphatase PhoE
VRQAERLALRLAGEPLSAVYTSDLSRAFETAQVIVSRHAGVAVLPLRELREIDMGEWEGKTFDEIRDTAPCAAVKWLEDTVNNPIPGGESYAQLRDRVVPRV